MGSFQICGRLLELGGGGVKAGVCPIQTVWHSFRQMTMLSSADLIQ